MQPTFQRRVPVPRRSVASFGIAPACDEPCASLRPVRFAVRRSAAPSVFDSLRRSCRLALFRATLRPVRRLGSDIPVAFRLRRAFELTLAPAVCERPRPRPPRLRERAAACSTRDAFHPRETLLGLGSDRATLPPRPGAWRPFALGGCPLRASRPSACPAATGLAFGRQTPLADFCNCDVYGHTGDRPIPASKRARERLVSLRLASYPAKLRQATRQTEPKLRWRRSAAAPTESTSSQRPRCGG